MGTGIIDTIANIGLKSRRSFVSNVIFFKAIYRTVYISSYVRICRRVLTSQKHKTVAHGNIRLTHVNVSEMFVVVVATTNIAFLHLSVFDIVMNIKQRWHYGKLLKIKITLCFVRSVMYYRNTTRMAINLFYKKNPKIHNLVDGQLAFVVNSNCLRFLKVLRETMLHCYIM